MLGLLLLVAVALSGGDECLVRERGGDAAASPVSERVDKASNQSGRCVVSSADHQNVNQQKDHAENRERCSERNVSMPNNPASTKNEEESPNRGQENEHKRLHIQILAGSVDLSIRSFEKRAPHSTGPRSQARSFHIRELDESAAIGRR